MAVCGIVSHSDGFGDSLTLSPAGKPGDFVDAGHFIHDAAPYTECLVDHTLMKEPSDVEIGQHQVSPIHKQGRKVRSLFCLRPL